MKKNTKIKIFSTLLCLVLVVLLMVFLFFGDNAELLKSIFAEEHTNEELREKLADFGIRGYITIVILSMLQVVFTVLPAEPVQVLAGITFGFPIGLLCCTVGVIFGNSLIYLLYKIFGDKLNSYFDKKLHFDISKLSSSGKITLAIFILYFLPAIPYGMICFAAATLRMKFPRYITVTVLGSIPSVCIGVGLGHVAIASSWILSLVIFVVLMALLAIVMWKKEAVFKKIDSFMSKEKEPYSSKTTVRRYNHRILDVFYFFSRIIFFFKGVKVKYTSRVNEIETPSIVLCNHGSFIDFAYAGSLIRKKSPNFVVARLYFYHKRLGGLIKRLGCFPKSMFAMDIESVKNCMHVIKEKGVLAMMPEARLSTVGKFEDVQEGTYAFIKKMGVTVYKIKISGDYLAKPKWAKGLRRGSLVEAELDTLISKDEIATMSEKEIKSRVESQLFYDEFEWLKTCPSVRYRSKKMAEGLENILSKCPKCKQKYTITTKNHDVFCESCGKLAAIDDRYSFVNSEPFSDFSEWYSWQYNELKQEIEENPNFELSSRVTLKHSSRDGKTMLRYSGEGVATLDRSGLLYVGTEDGESVEKHFPMTSIYRLLFGAGENFEIYEGKEIYFFVPEEKKSAVDWYIVSKILKEGHSEINLSKE